MNNINLLPWREDKRKKDQQNFGLSMLLATAIGVAAVGGVYSVYKSYLSTQQSRNAYVTAETNKLKDEIKEIDSLKKEKAQLEERMKVIQDLQGDRPIMVYVFEGLVKALPDGVVIESWDYKNGNFDVKGYADSTNKVSRLMRNLDRSPWFKNAYLSNVVSENRNKRNFHLTLQLDKKEKGKG